ncbi:non-ribosomal peptide synthetase [Trujillonella humicola]|uniref:non-ribosomal peptide synthetase n=1 Tax=Trujillonella humicola TaxID=3383699 RepID=UPI003906B039
MSSAVVPRPRSGPDRELRHEPVPAGDATPVPRWASAPGPGTVDVEAVLPDGVAAAVRRLAAALAVPRSAVLLAAHAVVLAALSGEREVVTGLVPAAGEPPRPCRVATDRPSWQDLVQEAAAEVRAGDAATGEGPVPVEAVLDPDGAGPLPGGAVLRIGLAGDRLVVRARADALDRAAAARIAGYHRTALALLTADPGGDPHAGCLLSPEELRFQLEDLAGPVRDLPDRRVHELVEEQARSRPDAVAVVCGARSWTHRELDARANRLARALLARGLQPEDVVAVVTERDLDWPAAVLGVLKAGGAYLPVEPHFPADRIATTLRRAGCRLVLTEPGATASLDRALDELPGVQRLLVGDACAEGHDDGPVGVRVGAGQLAYLYFTSGSTGEPKGAMCEHAGFLNHVLAKIDDLGITEGQVVAQTAPQCFDISLWQLLAGLVAGGRTLVVEQPVILDVAAFVDTLVAGRVAVVQVVPSYLDVVLAHLEQHPRALPDLRCVSVTGEALKPELAARWFATVPDVPLVNAYGLTETSDDTNHHVLRRPPEDGRVPLGRPIANVRVLVVDDRLDPVPLGAPGQIVFSGVCVGRGYVNDPERTRRAYVPDPHRPGERLYLAGDLGRWRPDGTLEFLGRRDAQVKVSGFRIELGEVENALLQVPGVRDGAVVVVDRGGSPAHLAAFCSGPRPVDPDLVRSRLAATLPGYMVPTAIWWRDALPLTANGKVDRRALAVLAAELSAGAPPVAGASPAGASPAGDRPRTDAERRLAAAWAAVLGVPEDRIGRSDSFVELGGTSLSAVKLAVALDRAISHRDVLAVPVLADLADLLSGRP